MALMGDAQLWGGFDGADLVLLTGQQVSSHPTNKTVNVVHLKSVDDAVRYVNVATQTTGMYPSELKVTMRDRLASAGAQRIVRLGGAAMHVLGGPHDSMFALNRLVHWMSEENAGSESSIL